ncbi:MAG: hypothetical protein VB118_09490 [Oscillospiraceae bacterium]|nr:hypothetical protein [Oscillospiraceae bacterium]
MKSLKQLEGSNFADIGRQHDIIWILFINGEDHYYINIKCSWRMIKNNSVYVGCKDIYKLAPVYLNKTSIYYSERRDMYDWNRYGANIFDRKTKQLIIANEAGKVSCIGISKQNDMCFKTDKEIIFQTFTDASDNDEQWRFYKKSDNGEENDKIILTGQKIFLK